MESIDTDGKRLLLLRKDPSNARVHRLHPRERFALARLARGDAYKVIASELRSLPEWLETHGLLNGGRRRSAARGAFGRLAARAHPHDPIDVVRLAPHWLAFLFVLDDEHDEAEIGRDPHELRRHAATLGASLYVDPGARATPLASALFDVRQRVLRIGGVSALLAFASHTLDYLDGCVWESRNRRDGGAISLGRYARMRRQTGGVLPCFDLLHLDESDADRRARENDPLLRQLTTYANDLICSSNDVFSYEKERARDEPHNLVAILARERGLDARAACDAAVRMHNARVRTFSRTRARAKEPRQQREATRLAQWVRAKYDWSHETGRYARADPS